jgi:hypothetical protein
MRNANVVAAPPTTGKRSGLIPMYGYISHNFDLLVEWLTDLTVQTAFWEMGRERRSAESRFLEPDICTARRV